jgi:hypothetical protein
MAEAPMAAELRSQRLPDPIGWYDQLAKCFRAIERRWLDKALTGAAIVSSRSDDGRHEYAEHYRNVGNFLAHSTNYEPKSPSRRADDQSDEKIVIVRGAH